jgi:hypothetical protein
VVAAALSLAFPAACSSEARSQATPTTQVPPGDLAAPENRSTTVAPTTTRTTPIEPTEPPRRRLVISAAGDTSLDADYIPTFRTEGYRHAFTGLGHAFSDDDLTIVNLECAATTIGAPVKEVFNFNCETEALPVARRAGVEIVNLANNHGADWGLDALLDTRRNVIQSGLIPVGVGADIEEATTPAIVEVGGWTIAVLGFNAVIPGESWVAGPDHPGAADGRDGEAMAAAVTVAAAQADLVIVTVHWGRELDLVPIARDIDSARAMIDAGADAVFGHHPHRLQPLEFYHRKPIAWSLGNFVWPRLSVAGATSAIARLTVEPDGSVDACLIPVDIESDGHPVIRDVGPGPDVDPAYRTGEHTCRH